jgi:hypothetical protein
VLCAEDKATVGHDPEIRRNRGGVVKVNPNSIAEEQIPCQYCRAKQSNKINRRKVGNKKGCQLKVLDE